MEHKEYIRIIPNSKYAALLIHGIAGSPRHFRDLLPLIPESWSVYNILLDGHGKGVKEFGASSMEKWKEQVSHLVGQITACHSCVLIIAHSMGSLFAIQEAIRCPGGISELFLLNCPLRVRYPVSTMLLNLRVALGLFSESDRAAVTLRDATSLQLTPYLWQYISWAPRFAELLCECRRVRKVLPQLTTNCVCFQSAKDEVVSMRTCEDLKENPAICCTVLSHSGHFGYTREDTDIMREALAKRIQFMVHGG